MIRRALKRSQRVLARVVDEAVTQTLLAPKPTSPRQQELRAQKLLEYIEAMERLSDHHSAHDHWLQNPQDYFLKPGSIFANTTQTRRTLYHEVLDLSWSSKYEVACQEVRAHYSSRQANRNARARLFRHAGSDRPTVICVHGYMGGHLQAEERIWPIRRMYEQGWDVALAVLPHHGPRGASQMGDRPLFPSPDLRLTVEGVRQAVFDLRALIQILRRQGAGPIGICGMSLGGYVTALMMTLEDQLAFGVPIIPLSSFSEWYREQDALIGEPSQRRRHLQAIEDVTQVIAPLSRPPKLDPDRCLVLAGAVDQVTPITHAERLSRHLQAPLRTFHGGHLLQLGRDEALEQAYSMMHRAFSGQ